MELEGQQPPQEPEAPAAPEAPPLDPIQLAAQQLGVDPNILVDSVRMQEENRRVYEENRRRDAENARREAALEARERQLERFEPPQQNYDMLDPSVRPLFEEVRMMKQMLADQQKERQQERENQIYAQEQGAVLHSHYVGLMRGVPSQNQIAPEDFFETMAQIYPTGIPDGVNPQQAVQVVAKYLGVQSNGVAPSGYAPSRTNPLRDPRASIVIPGGPTGTTAAPSGPDMSPQRPGETIEQYSRRIEQAGQILQRQLQESGLRALPKVYSSE